MDSLKNVLSLVYRASEILVYFVSPLFLCYLSLRKCFLKEKKGRLKLFLLVLVAGPLSLYFWSIMITRFLWTSVLPFDSLLNQSFSRLIHASLAYILFITLVFLLSKLIGRWLHVANRELVTFVLLMCSVVLSLSMQDDLVKDGADWLFSYTVETVGNIVLIIAGVLLYRFVITELATLTDKRREISSKLFIIPPVIFILVYGEIAAGILIYSLTHPFNDGVALEFVLSILFLLLFIWAFYVIIKNINATNEAIEAKELAAELAREEARIEADLSIAQSIQSSALPSVFPPFPDQSEFELFASMHAAKEVGGDFYDYYMLDENTLGFLIADVSGKSIPGAMFMMTSKTVIKSLAESGMPVDEVFTEANEKLCEGNDAEMFLTAWMGYLDLKTGLVKVANAGHNPPVLIRDGKAEYVILKPGLMLAGMDGMMYKEQEVQLQKGDILYLFTDGVTEAMDEDENLYGEDRLIELLSFGENYPAPSGENGIAGAVCEVVSEDIDRFVQGAEQSDDITMLCIRYLG